MDSVQSELTVFSGCCGVGGFELGLQRAGFKVVGACEIEGKARAVYGRRFGERPQFGDITKLDAGDIPRARLHAYGFPCQAFSYAGKRLGFGDTRGTIFFEIARIVDKARPELLLLENVEGLLNHDGGRTFGTILATLYEMGYAVEWQVINGKHFLPQNRERVFIVGHSGERPVRPVFPLGEYGPVAEKISGKAGQFTINCLDANYSKGVDKHGQRTMIAVESALIHSRGLETRHDGLSHCIKCGGGGSSKNHVAIMAARTREGQKELEDAPGDRSFSVTGQPNDSLIAVHTPERGTKMQNDRRFKEKGEPAFTLAAGDKQAVIVQRERGENKGGAHEIAPTITGNSWEHNNHLVDKQIRRLTPLECERLQGFPDGWTSEGMFSKGEIVWIGEYVEARGKDGKITLRPKMTKAPADGIYPITDTVRYKLIGNAVMPPVVEYIGRALVQILS